MAARSETVVEYLPEDRQYTQSVDQALDAALLDAIQTADATANTMLATVLRDELGSHYLDCGIHQQ
jgi:hypothetical protein